MTYGPDARPVEAPFNHRLSIPFVEWTDGGLHVLALGYGTTSYKLAVIGAAVILLIWLLMTRTRYGLLMRRHSSTTKRRRPRHSGGTRYARCSGSAPGLRRSAGS